MPKFQMPKDATIESILSRLIKAVPYIEGVFQHMHECKRENQSARVRIGVLGEAKFPHYRVEYDIPDQPYPYPVYRAFHGRSHKFLVDEDVLHDENWSSETMGYTEVQALLGQVRNFKSMRMPSA